MLASKVYIDSSLKKLVSVDFVKENIKELRDNLSQETKSGLDIAHDHIRNVKETITSSLKEITELEEQNDGIKIDLELVIKRIESLVKHSDELNEKLTKTEIFTSNV